MEKKNMKKGVSFRFVGALLAALLVLAVFPISALADTQVALDLVLDKESVIEGDEVTATVKVTENTGFSMMYFYIHYDKDVFEPIVDSAKLLSTNDSFELITPEEGAFAVVNTETGTEGELLCNWIYSNGIGNGAHNCTVTGDFAKITFKVKANADDGNYSMTLVPDEDNIGNVEGTEVNATGDTETVTVLESYSVSYDTKGGSGDCAGGRKTKGVPYAISSDVPTLEGYKFLGWATTDGGNVEYQPEDNYTANADVTFYAVWKKRADNIAFSVSSERESRGSDVTLTVSVTGTPEATEIVLPVAFGDLTYKSVTGEGWSYSNDELAWSGTGKAFADGELVKLVLSIPLDHAIGDVDVMFETPTVKDGDYTYPSTAVTATGGKVTVVDYIKGDVNNDKIKNSDDAIYLLRNLYDKQTYPISQPYDFNGDNIVNSDDAIYLLRNIYDATGFPLH